MLAARAPPHSGQINLRPSCVGGCVVIFWFCVATGAAVAKGPGAGARGNLTSRWRERKRVLHEDPVRALAWTAILTPARAPVAAQVQAQERGIQAVTATNESTSIAPCAPTVEPALRIEVRPYSGWYQVATTSDSVASDCNSISAMCSAAESVDACQQWCTQHPTLCNVINYCPESVASCATATGNRRCCLRLCKGDSVDQVELELSPLWGAWDVYYFDVKKTTSTTVTTETATSQTPTTYSTITTTSTRTKTSSLTTTIVTETATVTLRPHPDNAGWYLWPDKNAGLSSDCYSLGCAHVENVSTTSPVPTCKQLCEARPSCNAINVCSGKSSSPKSCVPIAKLQGTCCLRECIGDSWESVDLELVTSRGGWDVYYLDRSHTTSTTYTATSATSTSETTTRSSVTTSNTSTATLTATATRTLTTLTSTTHTGSSTTRTLTTATTLTATTNTSTTGTSVTSVTSTTHTGSSTTKTTTITSTTSSPTTTMSSTTHTGSSTTATRSFTSTGTTSSTVTDTTSSTETSHTGSTTTMTATTMTGTTSTHTGSSTTNTPTATSTTISISGTRTRTTTPTRTRTSTETITDTRTTSTHTGSSTTHTATTETTSTSTKTRSSTLTETSTTTTHFTLTGTKTRTETQSTSTISSTATSITATSTTTTSPTITHTTTTHTGSSTTFTSQTGTNTLTKTRTRTTSTISDTTTHTTFTGTKTRTQTGTTTAGLCVVGDFVFALYGDTGLYFGATIESVDYSSGTCTVAWDDGATDSRSPPLSRVRRESYECAPDHRHREVPAARHYGRWCGTATVTTWTSCQQGAAKGHIRASEQDILSFEDCFIQCEDKCPENCKYISYSAQHDACIFYQSCPFSQMPHNIDYVSAQLYSGSEQEETTTSTISETTISATTTSATWTQSSTTSRTLSLTSTISSTLTSSMTGTTSSMTSTTHTGSSTTKTRSLLATLTSTLTPTFTSTLTPTFTITSALAPTLTSTVAIVNTTVTPAQAADVVPLVWGDMELDVLNMNVFEENEAEVREALAEAIAQVAAVPDDDVTVTFHLREEISSGRLVGSASASAMEVDPKVIAEQFDKEHQKQIEDEVSVRSIDPHHAPLPITPVAEDEMKERSGKISPKLLREQTQQNVSARAQKVIERSHRAPLPRTPVANEETQAPVPSEIAPASRSVATANRSGGHSELGILPQTPILDWSSLPHGEQGSGQQTRLMPPSAAVSDRGNSSGRQPPAEWTSEQISSRQGIAEPPLVTASAPDGDQIQFPQNMSAPNSAPGSGSGHNDPWKVLSMPRTFGSTSGAQQFVAGSEMAGDFEDVKVEDEALATTAQTAPPSTIPTASPTSSPTSSPTPSPTSSPTPSPTPDPTHGPTAAPTTDTPSASPTSLPTTASPTPDPTDTYLPSTSPTYHPHQFPTAIPTSAPTTQTSIPTSAPTSAPTTAAPTPTPTSPPTEIPTAKPPTPTPTARPTDATPTPTTPTPTLPHEIITRHPTASPTDIPTLAPNAAPTTNTTTSTLTTMFVPTNTTTPPSTDTSTKSTSTTSTSTSSTTTTTTETTTVTITPWVTGTSTSSITLTTRTVTNTTSTTATTGTTTTHTGSSSTRTVTTETSSTDTTSSLTTSTHTGSSTTHTKVTSTSTTTTQWSSVTSTSSSVTTSTHTGSSTTKSTTTHTRPTTNTTTHTTTTHTGSSTTKTLTHKSTTLTSTKPISPGQTLVTFLIDVRDIVQQARVGIVQRLRAATLPHITDILNTKFQEKGIQDTVSVGSLQATESSIEKNLLAALRDSRGSSQIQPTSSQVNAPTQVNAPARLSRTQSFEDIGKDDADHESVEAAPLATVQPLRHSEHGHQHPIEENQRADTGIRDSKRGLHTWLLNHSEEQLPSDLKRRDESSIGAGTLHNHNHKSRSQHSQRTISTRVAVHSREPSESGFPNSMPDEGEQDQQHATEMKRRDESSGGIATVESRMHSPLHVRKQNTDSTYRRAMPPVQNDTGTKLRNVLPNESEPDLQFRAQLLRRAEINNNVTRHIGHTQTVHSERRKSIRTPQEQFVLGLEQEQEKGALSAEVLSVYNQLSSSLMQPSRSGIVASIHRWPVIIAVSLAHAFLF